MRIAKVLSYASWNQGKEKGTPSTGLGDKLKALDKKTAKFDWKAIDALEAARGPVEIQPLLNKASNAAKQAPQVGKAVEAVIAHLDKAIPKAKKDKTFPPKSLTLMDDIHRNAKEFCRYLIKELPGNINKAISSLQEYEKRKAEAIKEATRLAVGTEKFATQAATMTATGDRLSKIVHAAAKKNDGITATKAVVALGSLTTRMEKLWKQSETFSKNWRENSAKYSNFLSLPDKKNFIVPLSDRLMTANRNLKKSVEEMRNQASKARALAQKVKAPAANNKEESMGYKEENA